MGLWEVDVNVNISRWPIACQQETGLFLFVTPVLASVGSRITTLKVSWKYGNDLIIRFASR
jgi:hypothetical protein